MLSGRYRTEKLCSHWSQNKPGYCLLPSCAGQERVEDIAHILISCPSLCNTRSTLTKFTSNYSKNLPEAASHSANQLCSSSHPLHIQFLLDCSTMPSIIPLCNNMALKCFSTCSTQRILGATLFIEKDSEFLEGGDINENCPRHLSNLKSVTIFCFLVQSLGSGIPNTNYSL